MLLVCQIGEFHRLAQFTQSVGILWRKQNTFLGLVLVGILHSIVIQRLSWLPAFVFIPFYGTAAVDFIVGVQVVARDFQIIFFQFEFFRDVKHDGHKEPGYRHQERTLDDKGSSSVEDHVVTSVWKTCKEDWWSLRHKMLYPGKKKKKRSYK